MNNHSLRRFPIIIQFIMYLSFLCWPGLGWPGLAWAGLCRYATLTLSAQFSLSHRLLYTLDLYAENLSLWIGRRTQKASKYIKRLEKASKGIKRLQNTLKGIKRHHLASKGIIQHQRTSEGVKRHHKASKAIKSHQKPSTDIKRHHKTSSNRKTCGQEWSYMTTNLELSL